jgi:hypothetical protein
MWLRSKPTSSPGHWSKDYVEHLRGVHFALVTVAVGLILLLSSKTYDAKMAVEQMDLVTRTNELWARGGTEESPTEYTLPHDGHPIRLSRNFFFGIVNSTNQLFTFQIREPNEFRCHFYYSLFNPRPSAHDLNEFRDVWDEFSEPVFEDSVTSLASGRVGQTPRQTDPKTLTLPGDTEPVTIKVLDQHIDQAATGPFTTSGIVELSLDFRPCSTENPLATELVGRYGSRTFIFNVATIARSGVLPPVNSDSDDVFRFLPDQARPQIHAPFDLVFSDLVEASKGRMNENLATLSSDVHSQANKGDEALDAFGVKIPSEQVTRWGLIVLVGVQLYFLMYLKQLSKKLTPNDPAWDVPWMAMDQSRLAKTLLFVSVLCLPIYAASLVAVRALEEFPNQSLLGVIYSFRVDHLLITIQHLRQNVLILIGFIASVRLSILCWKYRPRLEEEKSVAPAQLFE